MKRFFTRYLPISLLSITTLVLPTQKALAQLTVTPNQTAQALADMLVGAGVIVTNATLTCPTVANGLFTGTSNLGIDSGIVLTSGSAADVVPPPSNPANSNNVGGDPDLNTVLSGITSYDACKLEFDFVPAGDTVKFDYVFGSSEYQSYSCSSFNDVFGFFITGPGYATPFNMATIPGTTIPICVNSTTGVSSGSACTNMGPGSPFSQYYVNNNATPYIAYTGFTTVFTAMAAVSPCDTYHLKLAIADGSDYTLDSGVFLKAGSLNSIGITLTDTGGGGQIDTATHAVRGCKPGVFHFSRPSISSLPLTIHYDISGNAVNGTDYQLIPDSVIIPAGQLYADVVINPLLVPVATGVRTVVLTVYSPYMCGNGQPNVIATASLDIFDSLYATPATPVNGICPGDSVLLTESIVDGLSVHWTPDFLASTPDSTSTWVNPTATTTFVASISQIGAPATCPPVKRYFNVHVDPIPEIIVPKDEITICLTDSIDLPVDVLPENYTYTFNWSPASYLQSPNIGYNKFFAPVGTYNYTITAYSPLGCPGTKDMTVHVIPPFTFTNLTPDTTINYGDQIQLHAQGGLIYEWSPPKWILYPNEADPYVTPLETTTYTVVGINQYGCRDTADVKVNVRYLPGNMLPSAFTPNGDGLNDVFEIKNLGFEKIVQFSIFNRYGQEVFHSNNNTKGWDGTMDGKPAPADVYNYYIILASPTGLNRTFKGNVTLLR